MGQVRKKTREEMEDEKKIKKGRLAVELREEEK